MSKTVSPLAPAAFPALPVIGGVRFAAVAAGVRYKGRTDVMLAELAPGTVVAGVFTRSATRSAPVLDCQAKNGLPTTGGAAIVVNSGNSNAFTGRGGMAAVAGITSAVATADGDFGGSGSSPPPPASSASRCPGSGSPPPCPTCAPRLSPDGMQAAARAIMTTDTFPKGATVAVMSAAGRCRSRASPRARA